MQKAVMHEKLCFFWFVLKMVTWQKTSDHLGQIFWVENSSLTYLFVCLFFVHYNLIECPLFRVTTYTFTS